MYFELVNVWIPIKNEVDGQYYFRRGYKVKSFGRAPRVDKIFDSSVEFYEYLINLYNKDDK